MRVQRVLMPGGATESWTLLGDDHAPVVPVERFLAYLTSIERSPNTVKAYAHDLKDWLDYLGRQGLDWRSASLETVAGYVAWLRLPLAARDGLVAVLPTVTHHCAASSVNRKLAALASFCEFHARHGVALGDRLVMLVPAGRGRSSRTFKPFLHHVTKSDSQPRRAIALAASAARPQVLTVAEVQAILDGLAEWAALPYGAAAHALECDDTYQPSSSHPGAVVFSTAATAKRSQKMSNDARNATSRCSPRRGPVRDRRGAGRAFW